MSITIAPNRPPEALAKDITRRLLAWYDGEWVEACKRRDAANTENFKQETLFAKLTGIMGPGAYEHGNGGLQSHYGDVSIEVHGSDKATLKIGYAIGGAELFGEPTPPSLPTLKPLERIIGIAARVGIRMPSLDRFLADPYSDEDPWGPPRYREDFVGLDDRTREGCHDCPACSLDMGNEVPQEFRDKPCPRCGHMVRLVHRPKGNEIVVVTLGSELHHANMRTLAALARLACHTVLDFLETRHIEGGAILTIGSLAWDWHRSGKELRLCRVAPGLREMMEQLLRTSSQACPVAFYDDLASAVSDHVA